MNEEYKEVETHTGGEELDSNTRLLATLIHLSGFCGLTSIPFLNIIAPLIFWLVTRERHPFLDNQGKEALNFQISFVIYLLISAVLFVVAIGIVLVPAVLLFWIIFMIIASIKANSGEWYRYPWTIRLVK